MYDLEKLRDQLKRDFEEHVLKDEDIVRLARQFGFCGEDVEECRKYLIDYFNQPYGVKL